MSSRHPHWASASQVIRFQPSGLAANSSPLCDAPSAAPFFCVAFWRSRGRGLAKPGRSGGRGRKEEGDAHLFFGVLLEV